jgi:hypothetical protein
MFWMMTSWLVRGLPRQFMVMWEKSLCSIRFHFDVPGQCRDSVADLLGSCGGDAQRVEAR